MKQRDIERVMAAAWAVGGGDRTADLVRLRQVLHEVDPHGLYRTDPKTVNCVTPADDE